MNKKILVGLSATMLVALLAGCGNNQASQNTVSQSSSDSSSYSSVTNGKTCSGSYGNKDLKTAINIYQNGTAHYVFYDPENGNTDDKHITWKYLRTNDTAHDQFELDFHDKNISAPVILTIDGDSIILTSKDKNWQRQVLYKAIPPINLKKFLASGGTDDNYEERGPASNSSSAGNEDDTDPTGDGISEAKAKEILRKQGVSTDGLIGQRIGNGWTFRTSDMAFGTWKYIVRDDEANGKPPVINNNDQPQGSYEDNDSIRSKAPSANVNRPSAGADTPSANLDAR